MISASVLLVLSVFLLASIGAMVWLLLAAEGRLHALDKRERNAPLALREPLRNFLVRGKSVDAIAIELSRLPPAIAARQIERLGASILAREQLEILATRLKDEPWVLKRLAGANSRRWWKRLAAARLLPMVYTPRDYLLLFKLVRDSDSAVAAAASAAIGPHADHVLVETLVRCLPQASPTLRLQQMYALRYHSEIATPFVVAALASDLPANDIQAMVHLGEILGTPAALSAIVKLADHPNADVRAAVARALRAAFVPGGPEAARKLLKDPDWRVRAAAGRAVEGLRVTNAIPELREALRDGEWWVRFRAAGALAALGEPGSIALEEAIVSDDRFASEMAIAIGSLSEANRLDISG